MKSNVWNAKYFKIYLIIVLPEVSGTLLHIVYFEPPGKVNSSTLQFFILQDKTYFLGLSRA